MGKLHPIHKKGNLTPQPFLLKLKPLSLKERLMAQTVTYKDAGVDISAANLATKQFKDPVTATFNRCVVQGFGGFGGMFALYKLLRAYPKPVLVSSMDGVGTKLRVAMMANDSSTVGADLVNHCANDIGVQGASPIFCLDYYATGKLEPRVAADVIAGMAAACKKLDCVLIGGETAEMPGFYTKDVYDLACCMIGVANKDKVLPKKKAIKPGHVLLGLPSSGLHTNGYSLARKLLFETARYDVDTYVEEFGCSVGEELLKVHLCYLKPLQTLIKKDLLDGAAHITGGGITDNVPRMLPGHLAAFIDPRAWQIPAVFQVLREIGNIPLDDFRRTFNLGIGMVLAVSEENKNRAIKLLRNLGEEPVVLGKIAKRGGTQKPQLVYME